jgi:hypothetical protein
LALMAGREASNFFSRWLKKLVIRSWLYVIRSGFPAAGCLSLARPEAGSR